MRRLLSSAILLLAAATISFSQTTKPAKPTDESKPIAPPFSLTSLEGKKLELSSLRGKVVVINFWFTGCQPCVEEMPQLNALVKKFKDKDVVFIAPSWDNASTLRAFLKDHQFKYQVVPNAGEMIIVTYSDGTPNVVLPTHLVIDREGKIDTRVSGVRDLEVLQKAIARLVKTPSGNAP